MAKERLAYIDIAKGVLILFLLMGHALLFIKNEGINDNFINGFQHTRLYLWSPYYMPAFFVITGFCSNFNKPFGTFLWQNFKTLKIPAMIFGTFLAIVTMASHHTLSATGISRHVALCWINSGLWFLDALFISKILYWGIGKIIKNDILSLTSCLLLFAVGFTLYLHFRPSKDFGNIEHALMLTVFLWIGQMVKKHKESLLNKMSALLLLALYIGAALSISLLGTRIPFITNRIQLEWLSLPIFFLMSIAGSVVIIYLCKVVGRCRPIQFIGQNSLVYYMLNTFALNISVKLFSKYMTSHVACILLFIAVMALTLVILTVITKIVNTKYLRFTLGKF